LKTQFLEQFSQSNYHYSSFVNKWQFFQRKREKIEINQYQIIRMKNSSCLPITRLQLHNLISFKFPYKKILILFFLVRSIKLKGELQSILRSLDSKNLQKSKFSNCLIAICISSSL
jgi:hypothetical protein